jgi:Leucine-rich repeat (LRR) protein
MKISSPHFQVCSCNTTHLAAVCHVFQLSSRYWCKHGLCAAESLQNLTNLHTLSLSNNRLKAPIVNLSNLNGLCVLHLGGNPLQYFPELSQAPSLLTVSLANLLIVAEPSWTSWSVEMLNQRTSRLTMRSNTAASVNDTLKLLLSRSSSQHPLIAGGLAEMAAEEDYRSAMLKTEGLLPQLVYAMMSENIIVAAKSCETLCKLTTTKQVALDVEKAAAVSAAHKLMLSSNERLKQCGLAVCSTPHVPRYW